LDSQREKARSEVEDKSKLSPIIKKELAKFFKLSEFQMAHVLQKYGEDYIFDKFYEKDVDAFKFYRENYF